MIAARRSRAFAGRPRRRIVTPISRSFRDACDVSTPKRAVMSSSDSPPSYAARIAVQS
jgi:hypothetical protein